VAKEDYQQVTSKRPTIVDLEVAPLPKKPRAPDHMKVVLATEEEDDLLAKSVMIACPSTFQG